MESFFVINYKVIEGGELIKESSQTLFGTLSKISAVVILLNEVKGDSDGHYSIHAG